MAGNPRTREEIVTSRAPAQSSRRGELVLVAFGVWMIVGLFLDGWAHNAQRPDSFFTPWHAVLYSGFLGAVGSALWLVEGRRSPGMRWRVAIPPGYGATFAGLALFATGATGDLLWHQVLGIEANLAALLSPTHLMLMTGGALALTGPLRTAWRAPSTNPPLGTFLPALGSVTLSTGLGIFFTLYLSPFGQTVVPRFEPARTDVHDLSTMTPSAFVQLRESWAVGAILFTTVLVLAPVLLLLRRWRVPPGSLFTYFAAIATFEAAASEFRRWPLALAVLAAGIAAEACARRTPVLVTAVVVPGVMWLSYFAVVAIVYGMGWSAELWTGSVVLSCLVGAGLGLLIAPLAPPLPVSTPEPTDLDDGRIPAEYDILS